MGKGKRLNAKKAASATALPTEKTTEPLNDSTTTTSTTTSNTKKLTFQDFNDDDDGDELQIPSQTKMNDLRKIYSSPTLPSFGRKHSAGATKIEEVGENIVDAVKETWLLTKLAFTLLSYVGLGWRWVLRFLGLLLFVFLLIPGFLKMLVWYFRSPTIVRNIPYGVKSRNLLDIYLPMKPAPEGSKGYPVLVSYSGGAWIIGYKAWSALMSKMLSEHGILVITPDYRNFPQGKVTDMLEDVNSSMNWVIENCAQFGGDPDNVYVTGQSAGAHISALAILTEAERERRVKLREMGKEEKLWNGYTHDFREKEDSVKWKVSNIKGYIGISGVYDLAGWADYLHSRGLYRSVLSSIMCHDLSFYSPTRRCGLPSFNPLNEVPIHSILPPITLFHGTSDSSIPHGSTENFAKSLHNAGIHSHVKYYKNKTHTDVIIEDPMLGGWDQLIMDMFSIIAAGGDLCRNNPCNSPATQSVKIMNERKTKLQNVKDKSVRESNFEFCNNVDPRHFGFAPTEPLHPSPRLVEWARMVNPF